MLNGVATCYTILHPIDPNRKTKHSRSKDGGWKRIPSISWITPELNQFSFLLVRAVFPQSNRRCKTITYHPGFASNEPLLSSMFSLRNKRSQFMILIHRAELGSGETHTQS